MRIGIVGIGGVGGYFGGKLAREYENSCQHEIIFVARGEHLKIIQKNGLQLFTKEGDYIVRPKIATDNPKEAGIFDLVFFLLEQACCLLLNISVQAASLNQLKDGVFKF